MYLFFISVVSMQLVEFFIWRNVSNPMWNSLLSKIVFILLFIQPIFSLMILSNEKLRNILLIIYLSLAIPFSTYKLITNKFKTLISPCGHLNWNLEHNYYILLLAIWTFFFLFSLFYEGKFLYVLFGLVTLILILYKYNKDKTTNSMWCWVINSISLYLAFYLLFYLPFYEKK